MIDSELPQHDPLIQFCRSLPGADEDIKWENNLVYSVFGKMFVGLHLPGLNELGYKVPDDQFLSLTEQEGIVPSKYMARFYWVDIPNRDLFTDDYLQQSIYTSYCLVVAKLSNKRQKELAMLAENTKL